MTVGNELRIKSPLVLLMALFPIFVLLFLEPFSIRTDGFQPMFSLLLAGYGLVGALLVYLNSAWLLPILFKQLKLWWVKINLGVVWHLLTVAIGIWVYSHLLHRFFPQFHFPAFSYAEALKKTFLLGITPFGAIAWYQHLQFQKKQKRYEDSLICLSAQDQKDWLKLELAQLLFFEVSDNYTTVYYMLGAQLQRKLLRGSLKHFEDQLKSTTIQRCHHSYMVNLNQVRFVDGNTRNLKLYLRHYDEAIPVSRKYSSEISAALQTMNKELLEKF